MSRIKRRILLRRKVTRFSLDRNTFSSLAGKRSVSASIGSNTKMFEKFFDYFQEYPILMRIFSLSLSFFSIILSLSSYIRRIEIFDKCIDEMEFFFFFERNFRFDTRNQNKFEQFSSEEETLIARRVSRLSSCYDPASLKCHHPRAQCSTTTDLYQLPVSNELSPVLRASINRPLSSSW